MICLIDRHRVICHDQRCLLEEVAGLRTATGEESTRDHIFATALASDPATDPVDPW